MSLHQTPEQHQAEPPSAWEVTKRAERAWDLLIGGSVAGTFPTRKGAEEARTSGPLVALYEREGRWFAGQTPAGWRPYADVAAEQARNAKRQAAADAHRAENLPRLIAALADFALFPPEENVTDSPCAACSFPVRAHHGVTALGSDESGTFAAVLHRGCAGDIQRAQTAGAR